MYKKAKNLKLIIYCGLLLLSIAFITIFSISTSPPLAGKLPGYDSDIFMIIGKNWAGGNLPYVTAWDHKGPMIFFIEAIGFLLTGNYVGIYFIQIFCFFITLLFTFKSFRLFQPAKRSFALTVLILLACCINYDDGNGTEEFILPLIASFYYWLLKHLYIDKEDNKVIFVIAFLGGLILAFSFLTRLTNALGVCLGCLVLFIYLICNKQYNTAAKAIYSFLGGFALLAAPFIIYFYANGALNEMWYGTITFNIDNSKLVGGRIKESLSAILFLFRKFVHCFFLLIPVVLLFKKRSFKDAWIWLVSAVGPLLWIVPGTLFPHYGIILIPLSTIAIILLMNLCESRLKRCKPARYIIGSFGLYAFFSFLAELPDPIVMLTYKPLKYPDVDMWFDQFNIDKDSFLVYNYDCSIYLNRNITPPMRFFVYQDDRMRVAELEPMVLDAFKESQVKWVVVGDSITHVSIRDYVESNYTLVATGKNCTLYHLISDYYN